jgi:hypothetical protein
MLLSSPALWRCCRALFACTLTLLVFTLLLLCCRSFEALRQSLLTLCDDLIERPEAAREAVVSVQTHCIALHQLFEKLRHRQALVRIVEVQRASVQRKRDLLRRMQSAVHRVLPDTVAEPEATATMSDS